MQMINTAVIAQAAACATELGLHEGAAAKFIDDFVLGHSQGAAQVRAHVEAITSLPEAKTRPNAALALALSAETITADEAAARLSALPSEAAPRAAPSAAPPTLADRAGSLPEIGATRPKLTGKEAKQDAIATSWARVVGRVNDGRR